MSEASKLRDMLEESVIAFRAQYLGRYLTYAAREQAILDGWPEVLEIVREVWYSTIDEED